MYRIICEYECNGTDIDIKKTDKLIRKVVGKSSSGSGFSMYSGKRDIGFAFRNQDSAFKAFSKLKDIKNPPLLVTLTN